MRAPLLPANKPFCTTHAPCYPIMTPAPLPPALAGGDPPPAAATPPPPIAPLGPPSPPGAPGPPPPPDDDGVVPPLPPGWHLPPSPYDPELAVAFPPRPPLEGGLARPHLVVGWLILPIMVTVVIARWL